MSHSTSDTGAQYVSLLDTDSQEMTAYPDEAVGEERTASKAASIRDAKQNGAPGSTWSIGWKSPLLMWSFYIGGNLFVYRHHPLLSIVEMEFTNPATAILIALLHLLMFLYLRKKPADRDGSIPQAYVSTASNLLATAYRQALNVTLTTAFTQHL